MTFYQQLQKGTQAARSELLASDVIVDCLNHQVSHESYTAFLVQAYHHVRHTVPLLMACGSRLPDRLAWMQKHVANYIDEEIGHEVWIRNDIENTGADANQLIAAGPSMETELMVSYAYDSIARKNPVSFFGMVLVLEGTSVLIASKAAEIIQEVLGLPSKAFTYLRSHGAVDIEHIATYENIVNRLEHVDDRAAVLHAANVFYRLYADVFNALPRADAKSRAVA